MLLVAAGPASDPSLAAWRRSALVEAGEALFIPAGWWHEVAARPATHASSRLLKAGELEGVDAFSFSVVAGVSLVLCPGHMDCD